MNAEGIIEPNREQPAADKHAFVMELAQLARALLIAEPDATDSLEVRLNQAIDAGIQRVPSGINAAELSDLIAIASDATRESGTRAISIKELLNYQARPREFLLEPILQERDLVMLHAWRGLGKSQLALSIAYSVASGGPCLRWRAPKPRRVLYVDGELPLSTLQERMIHLIAGSDVEPPSSDYLRFITPDIMPDGFVPNLAWPEGQAMLDDEIGKQKSELVIIDSISTLCSGAGRENEAESWLPVQQYALRLRRRGIAVFFVHHDGKGGQQRGTSRREDILDTTIHLTHPSDYSGLQGARFEVHFTKTRGIFGEAVKSFEATMIVRDGRTEWTTRDLEDLHLARVAELMKDKLSVRDIAEMLNLTKSTVHRLSKKARAQGL